MEVAGLIVGSVALTGLFNNCVQTFQYLQLGRNFGDDYETSLVKLDVVELRFTRWGELMTMQTGTDSHNLISAVSSHEEKVAERLLNQIRNVFERAKQTSETFQMIGKTDELIVDTRSQNDNLSALHHHLQSKIHKLYSKRQKKSSSTAKVKWALYKKTHFDRLIEDLTELVDALFSLFPVPEGFQRQLCMMEVSDIEKDESLIALKAVAHGSDKLLEEVVTKMLNDRGRQFWKDIMASGKAEQFMGNEYAMGEPASGREGYQEWNGISGTDNARQLMGNVYGKSSFFQ